MGKEEKIIGIIIGIIASIGVFVLGGVFIVSRNIINSKNALTLDGLLATNSVSEAMDYLGDDYTVNHNYEPYKDLNNNVIYWKDDKFINDNSRHYYYENVKLDKTKNVVYNVSLGNDYDAEYKMMEIYCEFNKSEVNEQKIINKLYDSFHKIDFDQNWKHKVYNDTDEYNEDQKFDVYDYYTYDNAIIYNEENYKNDDLTFMGAIFIVRDKDNPNKFCVRIWKVFENEPIY